MSNPNNCSTCSHKKYQNSHPQDKSWCYMFKTEVNEICYQHTLRNNSLEGFMKELSKLLKE